MEKSLTSLFRFKKRVFSNVYFNYLYFTPKKKSFSPDLLKTIKINQRTTIIIFRELLFF